MGQFNKKTTFYDVKREANFQCEYIVSQLCGTDLPDIKKNKGIPCPGCGGDDRFTYRINRGVFQWHCRNGGDHVHGDIFNLLTHCFGYDNKEAVRRVAELLNHPIQPLPPRQKYTSNEPSDDEKYAVGVKKSAALYSNSRRACAPYHAYLEQKKLEHLTAIILLDDDDCWSEPLLRETDSFQFKNRKTGELYSATRRWLLVPYYHERNSSVICNYQAINLEGSKFFICDSLAKGIYGVVGNPEPTSMLIFTEGMADAASIATSINHFVIYTPSGQIPAVVKCWHKRMPNARICIAADNDGSGQKAVVATCNLLGIQVLRWNPPSKFKDWSATYIKLGAAYIKGEFEKCP